MVDKRTFYGEIHSSLITIGSSEVFFSFISIEISTLESWYCCGREKQLILMWGLTKKCPRVSQIELWKENRASIK